MQYADTIILAPRGPYQRLPFPDRTPWGKAQHTDVIMWGKDAGGERVPVLWQTNTAEHGGTRVHRELAARFFSTLPKRCHIYGGSRLWFEEDCESCVPLFIFYNGLAPDCWLVRPDKPYPREKLLESFQRWMPETVQAIQSIAAAFDLALLKNGVDLRSPLIPPDTHAVTAGMPR